MKPALQNIPLRTEIGKKVREAFFDPRSPTLTIDYTQLELRVLAQLAKGVHR